jgi:steroid delta-isomerase-like uncharacterized protein
MSEQVAKRFIEALEKLETSRDLEAIVAVFSEGCEVGNIIAPEKFQGRERAREFWTKYRDTFGEMRSTFRNIIATDGRVALEWTTTGTAANGEPINYEGVSILEIEDEAVTRFQAYFDAGKLGEQVVEEKNQAASQ